MIKWTICPEVLTQRDQYTNSHIPISDRDIILEKHVKALKDKESSDKLQALENRTNISITVNVGDLVYMYNERDKHHPRSRYIVTSKDDPWLQIRKFTENQLRSLPYRVKIQDVYKVPSQCNFQNRSYSNQDEEDQLPSAVNLPEHDSIPEHDSTLGTEGNRSSLQPQDSDIPEEITCPP